MLGSCPPENSFLYKWEDLDSVTLVFKLGLWHFLNENIYFKNILYRFIINVLRTSVQVYIYYVSKTNNNGNAIQKTSGLASLCWLPSIVLMLRRHKTVFSPVSKEASEQCILSFYRAYQTLPLLGNNITLLFHLIPHNNFLLEIMQVFYKTALGKFVVCSCEHPRNWIGKYPEVGFCFDLFLVIFVQTFLVLKRV